MVHFQRVDLHICNERLYIGTFWKDTIPVTTIFPTVPPQKHHSSQNHSHRTHLESVAPLLTDSVNAKPQKDLQRVERRRLQKPWHSVRREYVGYTYQKFTGPVLVPSSRKLQLRATSEMKTDGAAFRLFAGTLQRHVYVILTLPIFFTAFTFFVDVFTSYITPCSVDIATKTLNRTVDSNVSIFASWTDNHSSDPTGVSNWLHNVYPI